MNKNILKKIGLGITMGAMWIPLLALAQIGEVPTESIITNPYQISSILKAALNWFSGIVMTVSIVMLLWAAILFLTGGASEDNVKKAKTTLIYAIIGIAVAILAYSVQPFLRTLFGWGF